MKVDIKKMLLEDDIELVHKIPYKELDNYIKNHRGILEEICLCGSWRAFNYILSMCSETVRDTIDFYKCLKAILLLEDIEDAVSYISLMLIYHIIDEQDFHYNLYMYLDMENRYFHMNIGTLLYELELDIDDFNDYLYDMACVKEDAVLSMFKCTKRPYETGLIQMILSY